jgi:RNA polymerase sigma-70 factor (ECF subfamily)
MFSQSARTGILPARQENRCIGEGLGIAARSTTGVIERELRSVETRARERTVAGMTKEKTKHSRAAASLASSGEKSDTDLMLLYEQYKRPIHTYIYRLLGNQEDADDLTQEVFLRAFVSWKDLYDRDNLSPWLYRIATNLCVDMLRRRKRISWWPLFRSTAPNQQFERGSEEEAAYLPPDTGGIPEIFERDLIRQTLASMPEDYMIVLVLSAAQGLSYQDIATIAGVSPNAAATRISRAKRIFAEAYQRLSEGTPAGGRSRKE